MFFKKRADSANTTVLLPPPPTVIPPTADFDGNDGNWSTFFINVGSDGVNTNTGQNFRVIPSTSLPFTLVPGVASWCGSDQCANGRGVEIFAAKQQPGFVSNLSTAWQEIGLYNIPTFEDITLYPDANPNGTSGTDNIGLGPAGLASPILKKQFLIQSTSQDFYLGSFGLSDQAVNAGEGNIDSFLTVFDQNNQTASKSYGYTAGASYRSNDSHGVLGSLVLGGYDRSRFKDQNITIPFKAKQGSGSSSPLVVGVMSIVYHPDQQIDPNSYSITKDDNSNFEATIDSTLPYLWLPDGVCDEFASRFQLTYDKTRNLYTVNDTAHSNNLRLQATVVFTLRAGKTTDTSVSITLPYAAFDLVAEPPIFLKATNYFPLKKSPTGAFVLGRTLLQEAYIIVDYERSQFQLAPASFSDPMPAQQLQTIYQIGYTPPTSNTTGGSNNDTGGSGLSGGAIAGIVVGILAVILLGGVGFFFWWKKKRQQKHLSEKADPQEIDTTAAGGEVKHRRVSELDSQPPNSPKPSMGGYYANDGKDTSPFPTINEMESPPAELYSPPPPGGDTPRSERSERDYFTNAKPRRRGATRESSGNNTPGTPGVIHELPGDDGEFQVEGQHFERVQSPTQSTPVHSRGPSDTSLNTNIDQVIADSREPSQAPPDRRPSMHNRGPSDAPTVQSDSTAVSDPTPEERERWAAEDDGPQRPLSE